MNHQFFSWLSTLVITVMSTFFFVTGLRGIVTRKPFLFPSRVLFYLILFAMLPSFVLPFTLYGSGRTRPFDYGELVSPVMYALIIGLFWMQMRGYLVYGISAEGFRNCLRKTLEKLNLPFQETFSAIKLETPDANLQASVQDWMGTAQLRIKPSKHAATLKTIAEGMREEFVHEQTKPNVLVFVVHILFGIAMLTMAYQVATLYHHQLLVQHGAKTPLHLMVHFLSAVKLVQHQCINEDIQMVRSSAWSKMDFLGLRTWCKCGLVQQQYLNTAGPTIPADTSIDSIRQERIYFAPDLPL